MRIYNTLSKKIEDFIPYDESEVKLYTCGPTVYYFAHIGNLRTYIFEDILEKTLKYVGYNVKRVMNITDVGHLTSDGDTGDDKMLKGAKRENKTVWEIAKMYTEAFLNDMDTLNIKRPGIISPATDNIDEYIKIIEKLLENDFAYKSGGNIYFDISKANDYYKLSGKNADDMLVAVRDDVEEDVNKRNYADFVLWFTTSKFGNQDMKWDSPFGYGYPGWHIECTGIALKYLGEHVDIHCGGVDNIFPHHTNEIAQSEAYLGHKWCNYWMHGAYLNDQSGKMSKSNGDFLTVSLLKDKGYNPLQYRLMCLQSHYRKPLVFTFEGLDNAKNAYDKLINKISKITKEGIIEEDKVKEYQNSFKEAISNDLNTSSALTVLYDVLKSDLNGASKLYLIEDFDKVLSLDLISNNEETIDDELKAYIEEKIEQRKEAKKNKDFELADSIRNELLEKGIVIKDTREGTTYEIQ